MMDRLKWFWALMTIILIAVIVIGGVIAWLKYSPGQPVEISLPPPQQWSGKIYISGAVGNPGYYPFHNDDSIDSLIQTAGGTTSNADLSRVEFRIPVEGEGTEPQRVDINRAESWLLEALPGIGETLAQRIIDYRQQNGSFQNTGELLKVPGIGDATYEQIRDLITVSE